MSNNYYNNIYQCELTYSISILDTKEFTSAHTDWVKGGSLSYIDTCLTGAIINPSNTVEDVQLVVHQMSK